MMKQYYKNLQAARENTCINVDPVHQHSLWTLDSVFPWCLFGYAGLSAVSMIDHTSSKISNSLKQPPKSLHFKHLINYFEGF